jgi:hypothetical protein
LPGGDPARGNDGGSVRPRPRVRDAAHAPRGTAAHPHQCRRAGDPGGGHGGETRHSAGRDLHGTAGASFRDASPRGESWKSGRHHRGR